MAQALREDPTLSVAEICRQLGVSGTTFYRYTTAPKAPYTNSNSS